MSDDKAKQAMKGVKAGGKVTQSSDVPNTSQEMANVEAGGRASQDVQNQPAMLKIGTMNAKGLIAVVGLVVVVVVYLLVKYLAR